MITFTSFPNAPDPFSARDDHAADYLPDPEYMDVDSDDEHNAGSSKLTCPGETITSSHAYMR